MNEISSAIRSKIAAMKPVTLWRKQGAIAWLGAAALFLAICFVLTWVFAAIDEETKQTKEQISEVLLKKPVPEKPQVLTSEKLEKVLSAERSRIANNKAKITQLEEMVSGYGQDIQSLRQAIQKNTTEIESLRQWINELEHSRTQAAAIKKEKVARSSVRKKRPRRVTSGKASVPYELAAIDDWGGVPNAVIRANGRLHTLEQGSSLSGWTVETIDGRQGTVTLRDRQGQRAKISANPG